MIQSRTGHLWVGTTGGLARFDGYRFALVETSAVPQLATRPIFGFMEDRAGTLWTGHSAGAARYRDGRYEQAFTDEITKGRRVWAFAEAPDGGVWVASEAGLIHWKADEPPRPGAKPPAEHVRVYDTTNGFPHNRVRALAFDRDGTLWIATTGAGLVAMRGDTFESFTPANGFPHLEVRHVLADPEGGIWATTPGPGLVRVKDGTFRLYTEADGLPTGQLTYLTWERSGALWIGTWGSGVVRFRDNRFETISTAQGLAGDQIWSLHTDRDGSIWAGTWHGGLNRIGARNFAVWGKPEGLSHDNTRSVLIDRHGAVWAATAGGGVNRIADGRVTHFTVRDGLGSNESAGLMEASDGAIWVTSYTGGITRMAGRFIRTYGVADGLPAIDVRVVMEAADGTVWAGTHAGLARLEGQRFVALKPPTVANAPTDSITHLKQDRSGAIWVGTAGSGLYRWKDGRFTVYTRAHGMASNWPLAIHEDADGVLWVGSNGEGLTRIAHGTLTAIRPAQGLWDGVVQSIVEDRDGYFWITCNRGFFRVARSELNAVAEGRAERVHSLVFGAGDGLRSNTFASGVQPTAALDGRGHIWLPSFKGLVVVDPRRLPTTGGAPPAVVDEVLDTEWRRAARAAQPLSLVMVDIDAFKAYNDSLGHLEGDRCLAAVADVIRKTSNRAGDFAARYGGEEFVVILPGLDRDAARVFAEALRAACEARALPHPASPAGPVVTISAGVATALPDDAHSPSILVAEADAALYTAKRAGRNRVA